MLSVDTDELVRRLLNRAESEGRTDDTEDVIRRRLEVYREQTEPLLGVYAQRGLLVMVNGMGEVARGDRPRAGCARGMRSCGPSRCLPLGDREDGRRPGR